MADKIETTGAYPCYWLWRGDSPVANAVCAYCNAASGPLTEDHAAALRAHLEAWMIRVMGRVPSVTVLWDKVPRLRSRADFASWLRDARKKGINPI